MEEAERIAKEEHGSGKQYLQSYVSNKVERVSIEDFISSTWYKLNSIEYLPLAFVLGKLAVISGVGTRNYYRKLGYQLDGPYMSKLL